MQVVELAMVEGVDEDLLWNYFSTVTTPAIFRWQTQKNEENTSRSVTDIMSEMVEKLPHISEVCLSLYFVIIMYSYSITTIHSYLL